MANAIEISHLTKSYGKARGVIDVSLTVKEGDIFGFLGPNGAGKSTTIRSMLGFLKFGEGSIKILGMDSVKDHEYRNVPFYPHVKVGYARVVDSESSCSGGCKCRTDRFEE